MNVVLEKYIRLGTAVSFKNNLIWKLVMSDRLS